MASTRGSLTTGDADIGVSPMDVRRGQAAEVTGAAVLGTIASMRSIAPRACAAIDRIDRDARGHALERERDLLERDLLHVGAHRGFGRREESLARGVLLHPMDDPDLGRDDERARTGCGGAPDHPLGGGDHGRGAAKVAGRHPVQR